MVVSGKSKKSKKRKGKSQLIKETRTADEAQSEQAAAEWARDSTHTSKQVWHEVVTSAYFDADYQQHLFLLPSEELVYGDLNGLDEALKTQSALAYDKVPPHSSIDVRLQYSQGTFPGTWKHGDRPPTVAEQEEREETRSRLKRATHLLIIEMAFTMCTRY